MVISGGHGKGTHQWCVCVVGAGTDGCIKYGEWATPHRRAAS